MEYPFYAEQKYMNTGIVQARVLSAQEAEALGYEDGYIHNTEQYRVYVDGFHTEESAYHHLEELVDCQVFRERSNNQDGVDRYE